MHPSRSNLTFHDLSRNRSVSFLRKLEVALELVYLTENTWDENQVGERIQVGVHWEIGRFKAQKVGGSKPRWWVTSKKNSSQKMSNFFPDPKCSEQFGSQEGGGLSGSHQPDSRFNFGRYPPLDGKISTFWWEMLLFCWWPKNKIILPPRWWWHPRIH